MYHQCKTNSRANSYHPQLRGCFMKYDLAGRPNPPKSHPNIPLTTTLSSRKHMTWRHHHVSSSQPRKWGLISIAVSGSPLGDYMLPYHLLREPGNSIDNSEVWRLESFDPHKDQVIFDLSAGFLGNEIWIFSHGIWKCCITPGLPVPFELNK